MALKKWIWKETAEVLGVLGIIAGIVFLGYELRQNNELMAAEARSTRLAIGTETWDMLTTSPELIQLLINDRTGEALAVEEEFRLNTFWMRVLLQTQWIYQETPEYENWTSGTTRNFRAYGSFRRTWEGGGEGSRAAGKDTLDPAFVQFFEDTVINP